MKPRAIRGASSLFTDIGKHYMEESYFDRSELLLGPEVMRRLATARVILFGTGGVGSWCAEGLIRTGLRHLTIVDSDTVAPSNVNRQLPATSSTIGQAKTEVLRRRLLDINPDACVTKADPARHLGPRGDPAVVDGSRPQDRPAAGQGGRILAGERMSARRGPAVALQAHGRVSRTQVQGGVLA